MRLRRNVTALALYKPVTAEYSARRVFDQAPPSGPAGNDSRTHFSARRPQIGPKNLAAARGIPWDRSGLAATISQPDQASLRRAGWSGAGLRQPDVAA